MRLKNWPLLALIGFMIVTGGVSIFEKVIFLHLENIDHPQAMCVRISPAKGFSLSYIHSIYHESVIEEFEAEGKNIILKGFRTKSPAVNEYYGFEDMKEFHRMNNNLGAAFTLKRGIGKGQGLMVRDKMIYLSEIGERGDRILLRLETVSLGHYLLSRLWENSQMCQG